MADKHYVDEEGTVLEVDCGADLTDATVTKLVVTKPNGDMVEWTAYIHDFKYLRYKSGSSDLSQNGRYYLQSYIELGGWKGFGATTSFLIIPQFGL